MRWSSPPHSLPPAPRLALSPAVLHFLSLSASVPFLPLNSHLSSPSSLSPTQIKPPTNLAQSPLLLHHSTTASGVFPKHKNLTHLPLLLNLHGSHYPLDTLSMPKSGKRDPVPSVCSHHPAPLLLVPNTQHSPHRAAVPNCSQPPRLALSPLPTKHALTASSVMLQPCVSHQSFPHCVVRLMGKRVKRQSEGQTQRRVHWVRTERPSVTPVRLPGKTDLEGQESEDFSLRCSPGVAEGLAEP